MRQPERSDDRELWLEKRGAGFFPHYRVVTRTPVSVGSLYVACLVLVAVATFVFPAAAAWLVVGLILLAAMAG